ncbi:MAG: hypothetical protein DME65_08975 [Verrucomicrobia bacterium]|nr:MAG: hypothetical protein DME65_08975 [Verrucomicrobiota bacterium]
MTGWGQLHALPRGNIASRFTSMSGHANSPVLVTLRTAWPFSRYAAATLAASSKRRPLLARWIGTPARWR